MTRVRLFLFLTTIAVVLGLGWLVSLYATGYRFDPKTFDIKPTGLLVVTSIPDAAQILINGELGSATNATIALSPNTYDVQLKKDGFLTWKKRLTIKKEEVTKAAVVLFPAAPSLSALTFSGAKNPMLSPDGTKIAYGGGPPAGGQGLWLMELADLPIGFSREPKQLTDSPVADNTWRWSPDSRQILLTNPRGAFLLTTGAFIPQSRLVNIQGATLEKLVAEWKEQEEKKDLARRALAPREMQDILQRKTTSFVFSADETKVLYTASAEANIPENLKPALAGSSTQQEERNIKKDRTYVYDIKEDRNFLITDQVPSGTWLRWFPTSNHVILSEKDKITIMDYDGTNRQVVWNAPYELPFAIPFPNATRLLILTSLGAGDGNLTNLYALSLR